MRIAFNPSTVAALTAPPNNKDITFDLRGRNIFARGVKFQGTDTNTWRDIKINNVSIGSHTLDLRNGSNTTLTNTNGVVTINSTWRPVVDNLTSDSTTSSLSAKQGKVLKGLIDSKSNSGHTHDDRYLKLTGGTMTGNIILSSNVKIIKPLVSTSNYSAAVSWSVDGETKQYGREIGLHNTGGNDSTGSIAIVPYKTSTDPWSGTVGLFIAKNTLKLDGKPIALKSDLPSSLKNPYSLTLQANGTTLATYDGSVSKIVNLTYDNVGAAAKNHTHNSLEPWASHINGDSHAAALKSVFNKNKTSIPRNKFISMLSSAYGNGSYYMGYFLYGYENNPYGGFFVAHYDAAYYIGISNGSFSQHRLVYSTDIPSSLKNPHALTISLNGTSQGPYDGSAAKNINITPSSIGAATSGHNHDDRYLKLTGGIMQLGEGLKFHADNNYFGTNADARIISLLDNNDKICDGGLIIDERGTLNGKEYVTELLRIRDSEFKWRGSNILHSGNSYINGSTIKINNNSITVYSSGTADGRYVKKSGDTMSGVLTIDTANFGALTIKRNDDVNGASIQFRGKSNVYGYIGLNSSAKDKQFQRWTSNQSVLYTILDTSSTYTSNGKGVINGTTITQVDNATNADTVDGVHVIWSGSITNTNWLAAWENYKTIRCISPAHVTVGNSDKVDGYHATSGNNKPWGTIPVITASGYMDIGKHLEFHYDNATGSDYSTALMCTGNHGNIVNLPSASGTLALTSQVLTWKSQIIDMRNYSGSYWHPVTVPLPYTGYNKIKVSVQLNSGDKPSWAEHPSGITCNMEIWATASGWGTTNSETICLNYTYKFCSQNPCGWMQLGNPSLGVVFLRGGSRYRVYTDFDATFTPHDQKYTWTSGSYSQNTGGPYTSCPGLNFNKNKIYANLDGYASRLEGGSIPGWGTLTAANGFTNVSSYDYGSNGAYGLCGKNSALYMQLDGYFYQNEGRYRVLDTSDLSSITNHIMVSQYTTGDTNYPLVWSNQSNTNSAVGNQLYKSWADLYYNPKNKRLYTNRYVGSYANLTQTSMRHIDADLNSKNTDHTLYIGYGAQTYTAGTNIYASTGSGDTTNARYLLAQFNTSAGINLDSNINARPSIIFRSEPFYKTTLSYSTAGNEALCFETKSVVTSIIFYNGGTYAATSNHWYDIINGVQIKNNCLAVGAGWANGVNPDYKLKVGGDIYSSGYVRASNGFIKGGSSNAYVLLGGGSHKAESSLSVSYATTAGSATKASYVTLTYCRDDSSPTNKGLWNTIKNGTSSAQTNKVNFYTIYNSAGGPSGHGEMMEILSYNANHWQPQLWFGAGKTGGIYYRNKSYNDNTWGSWQTVAFTSQLKDPVNYYWANIKVSASSSSGTSPTFSTAYTSNWFRSTGSTGWYSQTYGGGINMTDSTWIRTYGGKSFYCSNQIYSSNSIRMGNIYLQNSDEINNGANSGLHLNYRNTGNVTMCVGGGKVGIGTSSPTQRLDVNGNIRATGQIIRGGSSQAWVNGRDGALLRETSVSGYHALWSLKTTNGSWDFGEYNAGSGWNNVPVLSYITDSNYNSGNNTTTYQIRFPLDSGTVALTKNIPTSLPANGGNADSARALRYTGTGNQEITAFQTDASYMGRSGWASYIICNHGNGSTYYSQTIAFPFWGSPIYRRLEGGTDKGWKKFYTEENPPSWNNVTNKPSSFTPSSHTHTWTSITDKIVAGNEFNIVNAGFKESIWFNYLPINDRSKSASINIYNFGNGNKGYAPLKAASFIKNGGTESQLLRADSGVATFNWSGQSGQPTWLWGGNSRHSYYVYNPSNFRVAYASSAGSVAWSNVSGRPSSLKNPYSLNVFGVAYDGSAAKTVTTSTFISQVSEATTTITDGTMLITSYASNNGFADPNAVNVPYKRKAVHLWEYIKAKTDTLYSSKSHTHSYLPLAGGTMNANARISHGDGNLYIGRADNNGWVYTQNIASHSGTDKWNIRTSGAAQFGIIHIASKSDGSFNSSVIECGSSMHLNYFNGGNITLCNGGGNVGIGKSTPSYKLDVNGNARMTSITLQAKDAIYYKQPICIACGYVYDGPDYVSGRRTQQISCNRNAQVALLDSNGKYCVWFTDILESKYNREKMSLQVTGCPGGQDTRGVVKAVGMTGNYSGYLAINVWTSDDDTLNPSSFYFALWSFEN